MKQFLLIILSIFFGFVFSIIFKLTKNKYLITMLISIMFTLIYLFIMYIFNDGIINFTLKLAIIFGYILYLKLSNMYQVMKKN